MIKRAELLFSEVLNALTQISKKKHGANPRESSGEIAYLEGMLQKEKIEFDVHIYLFCFPLCVKKFAPFIDLLIILSGNSSKDNE